jgi:transcription elongation factor SPT5
VTKIEKEVLTVLNQHGISLRLNAQQIMKKLENSRAVTTDSSGNPVQTDDLVQFTDPGRLDASKRGTVLAVYRTQVFVRSREIIENGGVVVNRNSQVSVVGGGKGGSSSGGRGFARPSAPSGRGGGGGRGRGFGRDPLLFKTVVITSGPYKGYIGMCKEVVNDTTARVELHTQNKTVSIPRDKIVLPGQTGGRSDSGGRQQDASRGGYDGGRATSRFDGGRTPAYEGGREGGRTPAWTGGRTPAWDSGSKTPAWDSGSKTPAWDSSSKTPAWDAAAKTPAWDASSRGPDPSSSSSRPAWESQYNTLLYYLLEFNSIGRIHQLRARHL